jgi:cation/acetate symporter
MIAFFGYDGFLYSIGYLAGWVVALFVIAEPMKRLGKFTFADALNARFDSRGIKLAAGISTLAVSLFYLIPQMVGAGALVQPLLGLPHWMGVVVVGTVVIFIVVTAGMVSTTWVQFIKGSLLILFSTILTILILNRGFHATSSAGDVQTVVKQPDGTVLVNGKPKGTTEGEAQVQPVGRITRLPGGAERTGPLGPLQFFSTLQQSEVVLTASQTVRQSDGSVKTTFTPKPTPGSHSKVSAAAR